MQEEGRGRESNLRLFHSCVIKANGMCLRSSLTFLCDVCDSMKLAYFTQCL